MANVTEPLLRPTAEAVPVPLTVNVCGLPTALSETDTVAVRVPAAVGVNMTATRQVPCDATDPTVAQFGAPGVFGRTSAKSPGSAPVSVTPVIVTEVVALLVSTVVICAVVPPSR